MSLVLADYCVIEKTEKNASTLQKIKIFVFAGLVQNQTDLAKLASQSF